MEYSMVYTFYRRKGAHILPNLIHQSKKGG